MSDLASALIINGVVLAVVLEADIGPHRKVGWFRVARPVITAALIVPFYLQGFTRSGTGLLVEVAATVGGLLLGLVAAALMKVYRSPRTGKPVSRAGWGYAAVWTAVIGARTAFSYGSANWFGPQLGRWMSANSVTTAAITDSLILMAVTMLLTRTISLGARAVNLPAAPVAPAPRYASAPVR
jgi:hypothetical protein